MNSSSVMIPEALSDASSFNWLRSLSLFSWSLGSCSCINGDIVKDGGDGICWVEGDVKDS